MHLVYEVLNRGTCSHAVRTEGRKFDLFLGRILTMRHGREDAGRFFRKIAGVHGV